ncbi:MAG: glycoside hydrolase family 97 N-terminal domain-containing protein, partial [Mangrovimonas sp.]|nr:glycoside hydrolase family 97 N-terminal domain-containing protein [Mangrovimonas sp.]
MKKILIFILCCLVQLVLAQEVESPSKDIKLNVSINNLGEVAYQVSYKGKAVIKPSKLGILLKDGTDLTKDFEAVDTKTASFDETWQPVMGEQTNIRNHYNQLTLQLKQKN